MKYFCKVQNIDKLFWHLEEKPCHLFHYRGLIIFTQYFLPISVIICIDLHMNRIFLKPSFTLPLVTADNQGS